MTALAARKTVALEAKIGALDREFKQWLANTEAHQKLEKHHTQVRALVGHLSGLSEQTRQIFDEAKGSGDILTEARNLELLILGLLRVWEFFRSKFVQRHVDDLLPFLQAADELAWASYRPILECCGTPDRRQPPLVFLNGGLSPYALSRDEQFWAEPVPGEPLSADAFEPILEQLPFPVIGVPWNQVAHLPDLPVVAHEAGHAVEHDFGLHKAVVDNLTLEFGAGSTKLAHWTAWEKEVFADLWGCLVLGPGYADSLVDFLAQAPSHIKGEVATVTSKYPPSDLRVRLCAAALEAMQFTDEANRLQTAWTTEYGSRDDTSFDNDPKRVVNAILGTRLDRKGLAGPLLQIKELRFDAQQAKWASDAASECARNRPPASATTIVVWAAAARCLFDKAPAEYAANEWGKALIAHSKTLIKPGTRFKERVADANKKAEIQQTARTEAAKGFDAFRAWARAQPPASPAAGDEGGGGADPA